MHIVKLTVLLNTVKWKIFCVNILYLQEVQKELQTAINDLLPEGPSSSSQMNTPMQTSEMMPKPNNPTFLNYMKTHPMPALPAFCH